jgi:hypothetical protein
VRGSARVTPVRLHERRGSERESSVFGRRGGVSYPAF